MRVQSSPATTAGTDQLRAQLAQQLRAAAAASDATPLSLAQQRLWFLDQLEPNTPLYNIPSAARLTGNLDVPALTHSINAIVDRHESLRTRFLNHGGEPAQIIDAAVQLQLPLADLSSFPEPERAAQMRRQIDLESRRPFDLSTDRLIRAKLLRLGPEEHVLLLNMHHIISDEWSYGVFYRELAACYGGFSHGRPVQLPELPIQYADFAQWQRDWLQSKSCAQQLRFWTNQLSGAPLALDLPTDRKRPTTGTFAGASQCVQLDPQLAQKLKQQARTHHVTLFMLLLAAFKALLYRITSQEDIIVGTPLSGRSRIETEELIGFFVNTLPLRTRLSDEMTLLELLGRERETALGAFSNPDLPFDKLVEVLRPERLANQTPFINVLFIFQSAMAKPVQFPGLRLEFLAAATGTAKFDLTLGIHDSPDCLTVGTEYNTDLFEAETITRWLGHFQEVLRRMVDQPNGRLGELPRFHTRNLSAPGRRPAPPRLGATSLSELTVPRNGQAAQSASSPVPDAAALEPRDETERRLQQVWQTVLNVRPIGVRDKFFALGGHSLLAVRLVAEVEKAFGQKLRVTSVFQHPTIELLARLLRGNAPVKSSALVEIQARGSRSPLVLVHGAGGGMFWGYANLARHLGSDQPVFAFKSRGLDGLEEFTTIERMADAYLADLQALQPKGPYYLGGYCFGGVVAFEMARRLHSRGEKVALLALINSGAPNSSYGRFQWTPLTAARFSMNVGRRLAHFASCPTDKLLAYLQWKMGILCNRVRGRLKGAAAKRMNHNVDDWLDLTQFSTDQRQVWHTHIRALEQYTPQPYPDALTLFRSPVHGLYCSYDPKCGWADYAQAGVTLKLIPGAHETIMEEPRVQRLASEMQKVLSQAQLLSGPA